MQPSDQVPRAGFEWISRAENKSGTHNKYEATWTCDGKDYTITVGIPKDSNMNEVHVKEIIEKNFREFNTKDMENLVGKKFRHGPLKKDDKQPHTLLREEGPKEAKTDGRLYKSTYKILNTKDDLLYDRINDIFQDIYKLSREKREESRATSAEAAAATPPPDRSNKQALRRSASSKDEAKGRTSPPAAAAAADTAATAEESDTLDISVSDRKKAASEENRQHSVGFEKANPKSWKAWFQSWNPFKGSSSSGGVSIKVKHIPPQRGKDGVQNGRPSVGETAREDAEQTIPPAGAPRQEDAEQTTPSAADAAAPADPEESQHRSGPANPGAPPPVTPLSELNNLDLNLEE